MSITPFNYRSMTRTMKRRSIKLFRVGEESESIKVI